MKFATKDYIINTVFRTNILPVSSECNTSCIFCSHKQNPEGIEVFRLPKMEFEEFIEISEYLSPEKKIVVGEAATRIIEGEPLLNRNFIDILRLLRLKYKKTPIQITTNAILLGKEMVDCLIDIGDIELNISVNCANPIKRKQILGLRTEDNIKDKILLLKNRLRYSGSMVIVPNLIYKEEIEETVRLLDENAAESVRIFLQGFTKLSNEAADISEAYYNVKEIVSSLRLRYDIPIIIEPSIISDLDARVEGVIKATAANNAGVKEGDIIAEVNGKPVKSRVEAFNKTFRAANPKLKLYRNGDEACLKLFKPANTAPGFAVLYDIDPEVVYEIQTAVQRHNAKSVLIITSEFAISLIKLILDKTCGEAGIEVIAAKNYFFGGNIRCAGLLTAKDIIRCAEEYLEKNEKPDLILLPPIMFDFTKKDMLGMDIKYIEERLGIPTDTP